jgi:hypothetical protein
MRIPRSWGEVEGLGKNKIKIRTIISGSNSEVINIQRKVHALFSKHN